MQATSFLVHAAYFISIGGKVLTIWLVGCIICFFNHGLGKIVACQGLRDVDVAMDWTLILSIAFVATLKRLVQVVFD